MTAFLNKASKQKGEKRKVSEKLFRQGVGASAAEQNYRAF